ncbi:hypothetical protein GCM10009639_54000 [Kitasatospora putterlickiae]|uniref:Uncharacterized protein n=1 Tax=Kitasatospora putterlickiae TaxID=221725 RepID=A0ABN1YDR2_9ACTN
MTVRSGWLLNASTGGPGQTRADTRAVPTGTMTPTGATTTRAGVIPGGQPLQLTMTGMTGSIGTGRSVVQGTSTQGAYPLAVTAAETFTVAPGHASLTRYDTVWKVAYEHLYDASGQTLAAIVYQQGTPGTGSPPTAPPSGTAYLRLWDLQVPAGASAGSPPDWVTGGLITDRRVFTTGLGGIVPASDTVPGAYVGQWRDNAATGALERWDGTTWVPWSSALRGIAPSTLAAGSYTGQWRDGAIGLQRWSGSAWSPGLGEFQTFVPTWTATTINPNLGNGSLTTRWCRVGRLITWIGTLNAGSTTNGGDGVWRMSLPVQAAGSGVVAVGSFNYFQVGSQDWLGVVQISSGATFATFTVKTGSSAGSFDTVSNTVPAPAGSTTVMRWTITYEAAS